MAAVELLQQHDTRELVRQCRGPERQLEVGALEIEAVRTADDEAEVAARLAPLFEELAEGDRVERLAGAVEQADESIFGNALLNALLLRSSISSSRVWRASSFW